MRQTVLLFVALTFVIALAGLVVVDIAEYGVHLLDVVAVPLDAFVAVPTVGALLQRPKR